LSVWDIERLESFVFLRGILEPAGHKVSICVSASVIVESLHGHFIDGGGVDAIERFIHKA